MCRSRANTDGFATSGLNRIRDFDRPFAHDVADDDVRAFFGQAPRRRRANTAPTARDDANFAVQSPHAILPYPAHDR